MSRNQAAALADAKKLAKDDGIKAAAPKIIELLMPLHAANTEAGEVHEDLTNLLSAAFDRLKRYEESLACVEAALALNPRSLTLITKKNVTLTKAGRVQESLAFLDSLPPAVQETSVFACTKAASLRDAGNVRGAVDFLQAHADARTSCQAFVYRELGVLLKQDGQLPKAILYLEQAYKIAPEESNTATNLVTCYIQRAYEVAGADTQSAMALYRKAYALALTFPDDLRALEKRKIEFLKDITEGRISPHTQYKTSEKRDLSKPNPEERNRNLALKEIRRQASALAARGKLRMAIKALTDPDIAPPFDHFVQAASYAIRVEEYSLAVSFANKALEQQSDANAFYLKTVSLLKMRRHNDAHAASEQAYAANPDHRMSTLIYAIGLAVRGDYAGLAEVIRPFLDRIKIGEMPVNDGAEFIALHAVMRKGNEPSGKESALWDFSLTSLERQRISRLVGLYSQRFQQPDAKEKAAVKPRPDFTEATDSIEERIARAYSGSRVWDRLETAVPVNRQAAIVSGYRPPAKTGRRAGRPQQPATEFDFK